VRLAAHAAPGAVAVAARSPTRATAFVPQFGSSFDAHPTGGDIVAIALTRRAGRWHARTRSFARGLGRQNPLGAAIGPDGDLYVSLWSRGRVVRFDLPAEEPKPAARAVPAQPTLLARLLGWALNRIIGW
jgi:hypothetical protein